ncbi:MAG: ParM/StbA family protein [Firmicutes bacterium]|nr:ParM/StbA family protein [Bacillota bacterium]
MPENSNSINFYAGIDLGAGQLNSVTIPDADIKNVKQFKPGAIVTFPSLIQDGCDKFDQRQKIKVEYDGGIYSIGIGNDIIHEAKYITKQYETILLTSIAMSAIPSNVIASIAIGMPISHFRNEKLVGGVIQHLQSLRNKKIAITPNGNSEIAKTITIQKANVLPENSVIVINPNAYQVGKYLFIDIGNRTIDFTLYKITEKTINKENRKVAERRGAYTLNKGILTLKKKIVEELEGDYNVKLSFDDYDDLFTAAMEGSEFYLNLIGNVPTTKYKKTIDNYVSNNIFSELTRLYSDEIAGSRLVFHGYGSVLLESILKSDIYRSVYMLGLHPDKQFANAKANFIVATQCK